MLEYSLRDRLEAGETVVGTFQTIDAPVVAELAGLAGMDFVVIDQEHGPLTASSALTCCMAAERGGASPIVRVRANAEGEIQRALDVGADGVEVPQIETREDAAAAAAAARFAPIGDRGLSPYVRAGGYDGGVGYTADQNERTTLIVHVEGERGVENLDDIVSVDGIDVVFLGPYDLSQSLGIPGQVEDERVESVMADVVERVNAAGTVVGTYADDPAMAQRWIDVGVQLVALYADAPLLRGAFADLQSAVER